MAIFNHMLNFSDYLSISAILVSLLSASLVWRSWVKGRKVYGLQFISIPKPSVDGKLHTAEKNLLNHRLKYGRYDILHITEKENEYLFILGNLTTSKNYIEKLFDKDR